MAQEPLAISRATWAAVQQMATAGVNAGSSPGGSGGPGGRESLILVKNTTGATLNVGHNLRAMARQAVITAGLGNCGIESGGIYLAKKDTLEPIPFPVPLARKAEVDRVGLYAAARLRVV